MTLYYVTWKTFSQDFNNTEGWFFHKCDPHDLNSYELEKIANKLSPVEKRLGRGFMVTGIFKL